MSIGRWRKRDDRSAPVGAKPECKVEKPATLLESLHSKTLTGYYVGAKGETYELQLIDANSSTWSCTRTGQDGSTKKFTLWFDRATQRVWWGSWTYYFEPLEAEKTGSINWYKLGPGKGFEWHRDATVDEAEPEDLEIKGYSLPGSGVVAVNTASWHLDFKFKPPPGLQQPSELQLFTELPEGPSSLEKHEKDQKADDETSAGSALSPHDTDTEHSEADERCPEQIQCHWHGKGPSWQVKSEKVHLRAPARHWHPKLRRRGE